jgi:hypothetical protein
LIGSSTTTRLAASPMQIDHCEKLSSTVPKIRCRKPIIVTAMIARSAIPRPISWKVAMNLWSESKGTSATPRPPARWRGQAHAPGRW